MGIAEKQAMALLLLSIVTGFGMWAEIFKEEIKQKKRQYKQEIVGEKQEDRNAGPRGSECKD